jgi:HK97 family phage prohead protease
MIMTTKIENRTVSAKLELRGTADAPKLGGRAAAYNVLSSDLGGFRERLVPGAFRAALRRPDKVYALFNHDANKVLGSTKNKTLRLAEDSQGLTFEVDLPDTSIAKDCYEMVRAGLIDSCSFSFRCDDDQWGEETDPETNEKITVRSVRNLMLFDVSAVTMPAYPVGTSVSARFKPHYLVAPFRVELVSAEERQELQDKFRRDRQAAVAAAIVTDEYREVEEWRTGSGTKTPLELFIAEQREKDGK